MIYYLSPGYDGFRAGRITEMIRTRTGAAAARSSVKGVQHMQADAALLDAEYFVPLAAASVPRRPAQQRYAAGRAGRRPARGRGGAPAARGGTTPRRPASRRATTPPTSTAACCGRRIARDRASVAATIYAVWRSRAVTGIIDAPARRAAGARRRRGADRAAAPARHVEDARTAVGASGIDFFAAPGLAPDAARDYKLLSALASGLDMLAGPAFDAAIHGSTNQYDYRWGLLHRLMLDHPLGGPFSVPHGIRTVPRAAPRSDRDPGRRRFRHRRCGEPQRARFEQRRVHVRWRAGTKVRRHAGRT